jgi:hypothetical protein
LGFPMVLHDGLVLKFDLGGFCFRLWSFKVGTVMKKNKSRKSKFFFLLWKRNKGVECCMWTTLHVLFFNFNRFKPLIISNGKILVVHRWETLVKTTQYNKLF